MPFTKMEGTGNDYIYVLESALPPAMTEKALAELAVRISDRHFGVGGDGLVLICPPSDPAVADFRMRMFNSDGSEAQICGNASRCIGKYVYDRGMTTKSSVALETRAGVKILDLRIEAGRVQSVRVDMGAPRLKPSEIPMRADGEHFINREITVDGRVYLGTALSMGNPHLVVPVPDPDALDLARLGPLFERHPLFPERVNTEFVTVTDRSHIRMRVWERGAGETLACGTGACAAAVACALNNLTDKTSTVHLRGGDLLLEWAENGTVYQSGPARHVFDGHYLH
ncbi:MAG: diaminopimelate epimerase [Deltaproteobacteria bacterium]|nr:diaminopimelate epimerase [Deltaproteobacteria bacterium]